jgi:hypothetical protein
MENPVNINSTAQNQHTKKGVHDAKEIVQGKTKVKNLIGRSLES